MENLANLADLLPLYYQRLFPYSDYYKWLSYGDEKQFSMREFSFTLEDDIYLRFQSFKDEKELQDEIKRLNPFKIDIGAIYNACPKTQRKQLQFAPVKRELVFDIDMTDYDEIRTCCKGADICSKCWKFMALACKILDSALRKDFGFKHILWVFSGRRGIHCWVCDAEARVLTQIERSGVAEYLNLIGGGEYMKKKVNISGDKLHHSIRRALDIVEPVFIPFCIVEQQILSTEQNIEKFLSLISEDEDRKELKALFDKHTSGVDRWRVFVQKIQDYKKLGGKKWITYKHFEKEVMLHYSYPRLDIHVSKGLNHLLKSPFCVHPKTGKICVPFTVNTVDKLDPTKVPTIMNLINQINEYDAKDKAVQEEHKLTDKHIKDYKKTDLNRSLRIFQEFVWGLEQQRKENIRIMKEENLKLRQNTKKIKPENTRRVLAM